jgi:hypothetical protein
MLPEINERLAIGYACISYSSAIARKRSTSVI